MSLESRTLYSSVLEKCKIDAGSCYLVDPLEAPGWHLEQDVRAESYLFYSILGLTDRIPAISAAQAIDSGFMLGYARRCQNPVTGANPFLEMFRRGYIRVFVPWGLSSLRDYLTDCLERDIRLFSEGAASTRFIFSSLSSISSRSLKAEPRFAGDDQESRDRELVALYGDMLARVQRGRRGLPDLLDRYYVWGCSAWGSKSDAHLLRLACETFLESLRLYSISSEKGHRMLPDRAACVFAQALGLEGRMAGLAETDRLECKHRTAIEMTGHLEAYRSACARAIESGMEGRDVEGFDDQQLRALLHCLETINQIECYFEVFLRIDESTRATCYPTSSSQSHLGPWVERKVASHLEKLEEEGSRKRADLTAGLLGDGIGGRTRRSAMYGLVDSHARSGDPETARLWVDEMRGLIDRAYEDVIFLDSLGNVEDIDDLAIACADIECTKRIRRTYDRLRKSCRYDARVLLMGASGSASEKELDDLATSLCWEHFLHCKERMVAFKKKRADRLEEARASGSVDAQACEPAESNAGKPAETSASRSTDAPNAPRSDEQPNAPRPNEAPSAGASMEELDRFRRRLPIKTLTHGMALFLVYIVLQLVDNYLFNPQGWVVSALEIGGIAVPDFASTFLQVLAFIVFLMIYEHVANRISWPSMSEVTALLRAFLIERRVVKLVREVGEGVADKCDAIASLRRINEEDAVGVIDDNGVGKGAGRVCIQTRVAEGFCNKNAKAFDAGGSVLPEAMSAGACADEELLARIGEDTLELMEFIEFARKGGAPAAHRRSSRLTLMKRVALSMGNVMLRARMSRDSSGGKGSDRNLVTSYDIYIQRAVELLLDEGGGSVRFLSEEDDSRAWLEASAIAPEGTAASDGMPVLQEPVMSGRGFLAKRTSSSEKDAETYVIDPIDGTANFVFATRHSCISIARLDSAGSVCEAVVHDPDKGECFWASKGGGAFLNGRPLGISGGELAGTIACVGTSPYDEDLIVRFPRLAESMLRLCADIRRTGSAALDLCYVAAGRFSIYVEASLSVWDFAAGALILEEAGGRAVTFEGEDVIGLISRTGGETGCVSVIAGTSDRVERVIGPVASIFATGSDERLVASTGFASLVEIQMDGPNGRRTQTRVDLNPKVNGVVVVPRMGDDVVLVRHLRPAVGRELLELPRGCGMEGEDIADTARRELREETGLDAIELRHLGSVCPDSGLFSAVAEVYLAEVDPADSPELLDPKEQITGFELYGFERLHAMAACGEISDGYTLAALELMRAAEEAGESKQGESAGRADGGAFIPQDAKPSGR